MSISIETRDKRILARWSRNESQRSIGARFGISAARVSQIVTREQRKPSKPQIVRRIHA